jgi:hypothetical protein|tara:strand:+ start:1686 stop:1865 length:180 start_codon:yes stop_codon:yes gene_type:complete
METGWLRKTQWLKHQRDSPDCFLEWETFKKVWTSYCNIDIDNVHTEAKKLARKIRKKKG